MRQPVMIEQEPRTAVVRTPDGWCVTGYGAARAVLLDERLAIVSADGAEPDLPADDVPGIEEFFGSWFSWGRHHGAVKSRLTPAYSHRRVMPLALAVEGLASRIAECLPVTGDLVADFWTPFVRGGVAVSLGVPDAELERLGKVSGVLAAFFRAPRYWERNADTLAACIRYLRALVDALRAAPEPTPVAQALDQVAVADGLGPWYAASALGQLLAAGVEPTAAGGALAMVELATRAEQAAHLTPGEMTDETLRLHPPFPRIHRWARHAVACGGAVIEPGDHVVVDVRQANRDPAAFERPEELLAGRQQGVGLAFGLGRHYCLGAGFARSLIEAAVTVLGSTLRVDVDRIELDTDGPVTAVRRLPYVREVAS